MPGCNVYNAEEQQVLVKFFGQVSVQDLEEQAAQLASNRSIGEARRKYFSFYAVTGFDQELTEEKIQDIAGRFRPSLALRPGSRTALVAPTGVALGIARVLQDALLTDGDGGEVRIFTDKEDAFAWLGGSAQRWSLMREHVSRMCLL